MSFKEKMQEVFSPENLSSMFSFEMPTSLGDFFNFQGNRDEGFNIGEARPKSRINEKNLWQSIKHIEEFAAQKYADLVKQRLLNPSKLYSLKLIHSNISKIKEIQAYLDDPNNQDKKIVGVALEEIKLMWNKVLIQLRCQILECFPRPQDLNKLKSLRTLPSMLKFACDDLACYLFNSKNNENNGRNNELCNRINNFIIEYFKKTKICSHEDFEIVFKGGVVEIRGVRFKAMFADKINDEEFIINVLDRAFKCKELNGDYLLKVASCFAKYKLTSTKITPKYVELLNKATFIICGSKNQFTTYEITHEDIARKIKVIRENNCILIKESEKALNSCMEWGRDSSFNLAVFKKSKNKWFIFDRRFNPELQYEYKINKCEIKLNDDDCEFIDKCVEHSDFGEGEHKFSGIEDVRKIIGLHLLRFQHPVTSNKLKAYQLTKRFVGNKSEKPFAGDNVIEFYVYALGRRVVCSGKDMPVKIIKAKDITFPPQKIEPFAKSPHALLNNSRFSNKGFQRGSIILDSTILNGSNRAIEIRNTQVDLVTKYIAEVIKAYNKTDHRKLGVQMQKYFFEVLQANPIMTSWIVNGFSWSDHSDIAFMHMNDPNMWVVFDRRDTQEKIYCLSHAGDNPLRIIKSKIIRKGIKIPENIDINKYTAVCDYFVKNVALNQSNNVFEIIEYGTNIDDLYKIENDVKGCFLPLFRQLANNCPSLSPWNYICIGAFLLEKNLKSDEHSKELQSLCEKIEKNYILRQISALKNDNYDGILAILDRYLARATAMPICIEGYEQKAKDCCYFQEIANKIINCCEIETKLNQVVCPIMSIDEINKAIDGFCQSNKLFKILFKKKMLETLCSRVKADKIKSITEMTVDKKEIMHAGTRKANILSILRYKDYASLEVNNDNIEKINQVVCMMADSSLEWNYKELCELNKYILDKSFKVDFYPRHLATNILSIFTNYTSELFKEKSFTEKFMSFVIEKIRVQTNTQLTNVVGLIEVLKVEQLKFGHDNPINIKVYKLAESMWKVENWSIVITDFNLSQDFNGLGVYYRTYLQYVLVIGLQKLFAENQKPDGELLKKLGALCDKFDFKMSNLCEAIFTELKDLVVNQKFAHEKNVARIITCHHIINALGSDDQKEKVWPINNLLKYFYYRFKRGPLAQSGIGGNAGTILNKLGRLDKINCELFCKAAKLDPKMKDKENNFLTSMYRFCIDMEFVSFSYQLIDSIVEFSLLDLSNENNWIRFCVLSKDMGELDNDKFREIFAEKAENFASCIIKGLHDLSLNKEDFVVPSYNFCKKIREHLVEQDNFDNKVILHIMRCSCEVCDIDNIDANLIRDKQKAKIKKDTGLNLKGEFVEPENVERCTMNKKKRTKRRNVKIANDDIKNVDEIRENIKCGSESEEEIVEKIDVEEDLTKINTNFYDQALQDADSFVATNKSRFFYFLNRTLFDYQNAKYDEFSAEKTKFLYELVAIKLTPAQQQDLNFIYPFMKKMVDSLEKLCEESEVEIFKYRLPPYADCKLLLAIFNLAALYGDQTTKLNPQVRRSKTYAKLYTELFHRFYKVVYDLTNKCINIEKQPGDKIQKFCDDAILNNTIKLTYEKDPEGQKVAGWTSCNSGKHNVLLTYSKSSGFMKKTIFKPVKIICIPPGSSEYVEVSVQVEHNAKIFAKMPAGVVRWDKPDLLYVCIDYLNQHGGDDVKCKYFPKFQLELEKPSNKLWKKYDELVENEQQLENTFV